MGISTSDIFPQIKGVLSISVKLSLTTIYQNQLFEIQLQ